MKFVGALQRLGWATGMILSSVAAVSAASVTFNIKVDARLNCQAPLELEDVPLTFDGTLFLKGDGTAVGRLKMTAYYLLGFRTVVGAKLGAPPAAVPDTPNTTVQLGVLDQNGLSLKVGLPQNDITVNARLTGNGEKCNAEFVPVLRRGQTQHAIWAGDTLYYCDTFIVEGTRCRVQ